MAGVLMSGRTKTVVAMVLLLGAALVWFVRLSRWSELRYGPPVVRTSGGSELPGTVVLPYAECPIADGVNAVWCASFQIAWNELCDVLGGPVAPNHSSEMVGLLNAGSAAESDLEAGSYVAAAGYPTDDADDILGRVTESLGRTFQGPAYPKVLPDRTSLDPAQWLAYSYLYKALRFQWPFERWASPVTFAGREVQVFGISRFSSNNVRQVRAAGQVLVHDYRGEADFIVELKTAANSARVILARLEPAATLAETIEFVYGRIAQATPHSLSAGSSLLVPLVDLDLVRHYTELSSLGVAVQHIRVTFDEPGDVAASPGGSAAGSGRRFVFDGPFLVMIQNRRARSPYVAIWVANAELLAP